MPNNSLRIFLNLAGLVAIVLVLVFFVIRPEMSRVSALRADIQSTNAQIVAVEARVAGLQTARVELLKVQKERDEMAALFPPREAMVAPVEALEAAAAGLDFRLSITDALEMPAPKNSAEKPAPLLFPGLAAVQEVPFDLELISDYRGLLNFFRNLENGRLLVRFGELLTMAEIAPSEREDEEPHNTGRATTRLKGVFFMNQSP